jgi:hypothetical protein
LLLLPLALRADYSPDERTAVHTLADARLALGVLVLALWAGLLALAWRRGRKIEAFGLGWVAIAYSPVANLLFPVGILIAERTLYLPSAGLAIAVGAALRQVAARRVAAIVGVVFLAGALRTSLRVPVWRDDASVTLSIIEDSPGSYVGPKRMSAVYLDRHDPVRALDAARIAARIYPRDPATYALGAVAAFAVGDPRAADSMLARLEQICARCPSNHRRDAAIARQRGYVDAAESLLARARAFEAR